MKVRIIAVVTIVVIVLGLGGPTALAQPPAISNYAQIVSDIKNHTYNEDLAVKMINCSGSEDRYNDLYQGLKDTQYGEDMKTEAAICHHNVLYYYGICEQIETNINTTDQMSPDCNMAYLYLEMNNLLNETRPQNFVYNSDITQ